MAYDSTGLGVSQHAINDHEEKRHSVEGHNLKKTSMHVFVFSDYVFEVESRWTEATTE